MTNHTASESLRLPELAGDLLLIVVGADLRAEVVDRPIAHALQAAALGHVERFAAESASDDPPALTVLVCTDLWYVNTLDLHQHAAIALGGPDVNAATAWLASRLPTALIMDDHLRIHVDPDAEPKACLWGVDREATTRAVEIFSDRYLEDLVVHACDRASV